jgi:hypothetical protein
MKHFILTITAIALLTAYATGQTKFGIEAGAVSSGYAVKKGGQRIFTADKLGGAFGLGFDSKIKNHVYIQTALLYVMNGYLQNTAKGDLTFSVNTLELPLTLIYKTEKGIGNRMFFGGGPYLGINLFGDKKYSPADSTEFFVKTNIGNNQSDSLKYFDYGLRLVGGYELKNGFFIRVHYQQGFANQSAINDDKNLLRNKSTGISVGYLIGTSKEKKAERRNRAFRSHGLEM